MDAARWLDPRLEERDATAQGPGEERTEERSEARLVQRQKANLFRCDYRSVIPIM